MRPRRSASGVAPRSSCPSPASRTTARRPGRPTCPTWVRALRRARGDAPARSGAGDRAPARPATACQPADDGPRFDRATLAREAGLDDGRLHELEAYGLVVPVEGEGMRAVYDLEALAMARAAAGFFRHGIGARHIKMYQHFAEREAVLFAQVLLPFLRQRNPVAHARFESDLADLTRQSRALRGVLSNT